MKHETLFLKIIIFLMGIVILGLCIYLLPQIAIEAMDHYILFPILISMSGSAIPFFIALSQALKLLNYIDNNTAFSDLSVKALKRIEWCAITISVLYIVILPLLYVIAELDDAPGILAIGLIITFASLVITIFAAVLQKLLKHAVDIKTENDLTI